MDWQTIGSGIIAVEVLVLCFGVFGLVESMKVSNGLARFLHDDLGDLKFSLKSIESTLGRINENTHENRNILRDIRQETASKAGAIAANVNAIHSGVAAIVTSLLEIENILNDRPAGEDKR